MVVNQKQICILYRIDNRLYEQCFASYQLKYYITVGTYTTIIIFCTIV